MELITTFKEDISEIGKYKSVVVAIKHFSVGQDHIYSPSEIESMIKQGKNQVRIYILLNKMIFDEDVDLLKKILLWLKKIAVAGIYFSDMAVFMLAKQLEMQDLLIYAPGMTIVNSKDVKEYLALGIAGVELANEITLREKIEIAKNNPNKVGIVISGYMLMSYSKRKALSNYFRETDKSVNLKDNYNLRLKEATRNGLMPVYEDSHGTYIYSDYILDSFEFISDLMRVDFKYFRIDGIFLTKAMINEFYSAYTKAISGIKDDYQTIIQSKYPQLNFDNIFYTTETSEVK